MGSIANPKVPVIDLSNQDLTPTSHLWLETCKQACEGLEEYGCFVAVYNKVPEELDAGIFAAAEELFGLPTETKKKNVIEKPYHGYVGQMSVIPLHEGMGVDHVTNMEDVRKFTATMWPNGNGRFSETVFKYSNAVAELDRMVVRMIFDNYGVARLCDSHIEAKTYLLKFLKYLAPEDSNPTLAFPRHTDKTFLSILHQNDVNGLEVRNREGRWIGLELPPKAYVVMAGDVSMGWSNGRILSCVHKVTMRGTKSRYTLGLFSFVSGTIQSPEELVDEKNPLKYKPFNNIDLIKFYATDEGRKAECTLTAYCGV